MIKTRTGPGLEKRLFRLFFGFVILVRPVSLFARGTFDERTSRTVGITAVAITVLIVFPERAAPLRTVIAEFMRGRIIGNIVGIIVEVVSGIGRGNRIEIPIHRTFGSRTAGIEIAARRPAPLLPQSLPELPPGYCPKFPLRCSPRDPAAERLPGPGKKAARTEEVLP